MQNRILQLGLVIGLLGTLSGCKKSEPGGQAGGGGNHSGKGIVLKAKWPVGNRYTYRMDLDQQSVNTIPQMPKPIQQNLTMAMTYALSVIKESPDGSHEVEMEFLANEMEIKMGGQVMLTFDSKEPSPNGPQKEIVAPFRKMIGSKLRMEIGPDGKVSKVIGLEEWTKSITDDASGPAGQMMMQQFNEGFFHQIADFGRALSTQAVEVGKTWPYKTDFPMGPTGKMEIDAKITFKGFADRDQRHCAVLDTKATLKGSQTPAGDTGTKLSIDNGKVTGTSWFDPELGALVESAADQVLRVKGEVPGPPGRNGAKAQFTSDINQKVSVKLVELGKANG